METYSVQEIAEKLGTHPETVRRWIRSGKMKSYQSCKNSGYVVTELMLDEFLTTNPKYTVDKAPTNELIETDAKESLEMVIKALTLSIERKEEIIKLFQDDINYEIAKIETLSQILQYHLNGEA